ncbi:uncharacterized protein LOC135343945 isoform X3 [Halichondria panicea]|uniref:uncharacterized protein LOC135343945 isoform X3 n=1 Tax=Halichondria panicea TaxID=6063 RepID=UPI00312B768F
MKVSFRIVLLSVATFCGCLYYVNALASLSTSTIAVNEGDSVQLCVNIDEPQDVTVQLLVSILTSTLNEGTDFDISSKELQFTADGPTQICFDIEAYPDDIVENGELFQISIGGTITVGATGFTVVTISDASRIDVSLTQENYAAVEEAEDTSVMVCAMIVSGSIQRQVSVTLDTVDMGTASSADDYIPSGAVSKIFSPIDASEPQCTNIAIRSDDIIEEVETFMVSLTAGMDAVNVITGEATVSITDNDGVNLAVSSSSVLIPEGDSGLTDVNIDLTVALNGLPLDRAVTVLANTIDGTATVGNNDFVQLVNEPFTIPATAADGDSFTFTAQIVGDLVEEMTELYRIQFTAENENDAFGLSQVFVRIQDDGDAVRDCEALADPANGQVTVNPDTLEDSIATYTCNVGFDLNGNETRTCFNSGWGGEAPTCQEVDCGNLMNPQNGMIQTSNTNYEGLAIYSCVSGYELDTGAITVTRICQLNSMWSGTAPQCVPVTCLFLADPTNGIVRYPNGATMFEDTAEYECDAGYDLTGTPVRTCQANREWSLTAPICTPVSCGELSNPENGIVEVSSSLFPGTATYFCNTNFELVNGPQIRMCQANETWSEIAPRCQVIECPTLQNPDNGEVNIQVGINGDTTATYSCNEGYELNGNNIRNCEASSQWSGTAATCEIIECADLVDPENGAVTVGSNTFQSEAMYSCNSGYDLRGSSTTVCQSNSMWSNGPPFCAIVVCDGLSPPVNGTLLLSSVVFNSQATYGCNSGFMINGPTVRICQQTGSWSGNIPTCEEILCPELEVSQGTINTTNGYRTSSVATVQCSNGYRLSGQSSLTCQITGEWTDDEPTCEPADNVGLYVGIAIPVGLVMIAATVIIILLLYIIHKQRAKKQQQSDVATYQATNSEYYEDINDAPIISSSTEVPSTQEPLYTTIEESTDSNSNLTESNANGDVITTDDYYYVNEGMGGINEVTMKTNKAYGTTKKLQMVANPSSVSHDPPTILNPAYGDVTTTNNSVMATDANRLSGTAEVAMIRNEAYTEVRWSNIPTTENEAYTSVTADTES